MRTTYLRIRDGKATRGFALNQADLELIIAEHFDLDPDTLHVSGLSLDGEINVSGTAADPQDEDEMDDGPSPSR